jgi:hypothetical protein
MVRRDSPVNLGAREVLVLKESPVEVAKNGHESTVTTSPIPGSPVPHLPPKTTSDSPRDEVTPTRPSGLGLLLISFVGLLAGLYGVLRLATWLFSMVAR